MNITADTRPSEIEILKPYLNYLMYKCVPVDRPAVEMTYAEMKAEQPTWDVDSMIRGTEHLCEIAASRQVLYDVYSPEECAADPEKGEIKLFFLPAIQQPSEKPFVLLTAGGAFSCVCSLVEAFPTAARLNELGYNAFVLNYRVGQNPALPRAEEDVAAALNYILSHKTDFGVQSDEYVMSGFSAGGAVTVTWGSKNEGWGKYGLPKPKALFPIYSGASAEYLQTVDRSYPPCYIVHAKDDPFVPYQNSENLKRFLEEYDIPVKLELAESGGHGWGDGSGTPAAGWPDRAAAFENTLHITGERGCI